LEGFLVPADSKPGSVLLAIYLDQTLPSGSSG